MTLSETRLFLDLVRGLLDQVGTAMENLGTGGPATFVGPLYDVLESLDAIRGELDAYEAKWPQIVYSAEEVARQLGERNNK